MAVALAMRLLGPVGRGLGYDEISMLVGQGRTSLGGLFAGEGGSHHYPLQSVLAWISLNTLGESAFALRVPALLFGTAAIGAMLRLSVRVSTRRVAVLATLLLLLSYHAVWFSQNASGYAGLLFLSLVSTLFFLRCMDEDGLGHSIGAGVSLALAGYIHIAGLFLIVAHGLIAAVWAMRSRWDTGGWPTRVWQPVFGVGLGLALVALLYWPMLPEALAYFSPVNVEGALAPTWRSFPVWPFAPDDMGVTVLDWTRIVQLGCGVALALVVCTCGLLSYLKERLELGLLCAVPGVLGCCALGFLGREIWSGFLFAQLGFFLICLAKGLSVIAIWLGERRGFAHRLRAERTWFVAGSGVALLASLLALPLVYQRPQQDFEGALEFVHSQRTADVQVATVGLARMPYEKHFYTDFEPIGTVAQLLKLNAEATPVIVLRTSSDFLAVSQEELSTYLDHHGVEIARFRGTRVGGDLLVLRIGKDSANAGEDAHL